MNTTNTCQSRNLESYYSERSNTIVNAKKKLCSTDRRESEEQKSNEDCATSSMYKCPSVKRSFTAQTQQYYASTLAFSSPNKQSLSFSTEKGYQTRSLYKTILQNDQAQPRISEEDNSLNSQSFGNISSNSPSLDQPVTSFRNWTSPQILHDQMRTSMLHLQKYQKSKENISTSSLDTDKQSYFSSQSFKSSSTFKKQQEESPYHTLRQKEQESTDYQPFVVNGTCGSVIRSPNGFNIPIYDKNSTVVFKTQRSDLLIQPLKCDSFRNQINEEDSEEPEDIRVEFFQEKEAPWYEDQENCIKYLIRSGIRAKKFVFSSNDNSDNGKEVIIKLSFDQKELVITRPDNLSKRATHIPVNSIQGIIYGAFSSTFKRYYDKIIDSMRILQKHYLNNATNINQDTSLLTQYNQDENFYSWECVSLCLDYRTFDFRIPDYQSLEEKYILLNGIQSLICRHFPLYNPISIPNLRLINVKLKISFEALRQGKTIVELFFIAIEKTLDQLHKQEITFDKLIQERLREEKQRVLSKYVQALSQQTKTQEIRKASPTIEGRQSLNHFVNLCKKIQGVDGDNFFNEREKSKTIFLNLRLHLHQHMDHFSFNDKVLDIKIKRKLLELNRNDALLNFVAQKKKFKLVEEMNPKLYSRSFNYYAHSHNLLYSLMKYYVEKEDQNAWLIENKNNLVPVKSFQEVEKRSQSAFGFLSCIGIRCCTSKKLVDPKKMKMENNKKAMEDADQFVNQAMHNVGKKDQMEAIRGNLLKLKQFINLQQKDGYIKKIRNTQNRIERRLNDSFGHSMSRSLLNISEGQVRREFIRVNEKKSHKRFKSQFTTILKEKDYKKAIQKAEQYKQREELYFSPSHRKTQNGSIDDLKNQFRQAFKRKRTTISLYSRTHTTVY